VNPTIALTFILLFLMIAAGVVSGSWGYALGREALKGITQPDVRPTSAFGNISGVPRREQVPLILSEADILADVKARMEGKARNTEIVPNSAITPSPTTSPGATPSSPSPASANKADSASASLAPSSPNSSVTFPLISQDQGVALEVTSVHQRDGMLVVDVKLQNTSVKTVSFLYSFMNVTDDQGHPFSATTEGLPADLPANGQTFTGTVSIPMALLEGAETLSLSLTDYPDQRLQLNLAGIPIAR